MRRSPTLLWSCIALQLVAVLLTVASPVLCVGDDGHIAVERSHAVACVSDWVRHHGDAPPRADLASHDCEDIPLGQVGVARESTRFDDMHASAIVLAYSTDGGVEATGTVWMRATSMGAGAHALRASVVLLI